MQLEPLTPNAALIGSEGAILRFRIAKGELGIYQTLQAMSSLVKRSQTSPALEEIAKLVNARAFSTGRKFYPDSAAQLAALAMYSLAQEYLKFNEDPLGMEFLREPSQTALAMLGAIQSRRPRSVLVDCDDNSMLCVAVLRRLGYMGAFVVMSREGQPTGPFIHVLPALMLGNGQIFPIDAQENAQPGTLLPFGRAAVWRVE